MATVWATLTGRMQGKHCHAGQSMLVIKQRCSADQHALIRKLITSVYTTLVKPKHTVLNSNPRKPTAPSPSWHRCKSVQVQSYTSIANKSIPAVHLTGTIKAICKIPDAFVASTTLRKLQCMTGTHWETQVLAAGVYYYWSQRSKPEKVTLHFINIFAICPLVHTSRK